MKEISSIKPIRPQTHVMKNKTEVNIVNKKSNISDIIDLLLSDNYCIVGDFYSTGLKILFELKKNIFSKNVKNNFLEERKKRNTYHLASNKLLIPIKSNKIDLKKAPELGWLNILYPDISSFFLSLPQIQGLNSSWQWYIKGIKFPVLHHKVFPYYGTYFPTRFEHLDIFEKWLKKYKYKKDMAIDIGTGCGILTFQLINNGFKKVYASDINPNCIISVFENAQKHNYSDKIILNHGNLFENCNIKADLIVFNPPWLPHNNKKNIIDQAIYYESNLFNIFFENAKNYLNENGKIIILFSNFAQVNKLSDIHPIENELINNNRYKKINIIKSAVKKKSDKTTRKDMRKNELVELWIIEPSIKANKF